jgi:hypothetical protein
MLSGWLERQWHGQKWTRGAITAIQFFPSAIFGGKLMGYLGQFAHLSTISRAVINLIATLISALLATAVVPLKIGFPCTDFGIIVRDSMGFGLGIAWNVFTLSIFAPDQLDAAHLLGLAGYLALVLLIAFRVAAEGSYLDTLERPPNIIDRMWPLLSFAMNTACAFTMVAFVGSLTHGGWLGDVECFFILLIFSALMAAGVSNMDVTESNREYEMQQQHWGMDHLPCVLKVLVFIPCFWCCCPWLPMLFLLSGVHGIGVKEKWFSLISMISGLAASIVASGMLTASANAMAGSLGVCKIDYCPHPWTFVAIQVAVATVATIILIPTLIPLVPPFLCSLEQGPDQGQQHPPQTTLEYNSKDAEDNLSLLSPNSQTDGKRRILQYLSV